MASTEQPSYDPSSTTTVEIPPLKEAFAKPDTLYSGTFVVFDLVDSTKMKSEMPEAAWLPQLGWMYDTVSATALQACPEAGIKYLGDGVLLFLSSDRAAEAINVAIATQEAINEACQGHGSGSMGAINIKVKVGVATGNARRFRTKDGSTDYVGAVVDRAFRLCGAANASAVFVDRPTAGAANMVRVASQIGKLVGRSPDEYQGDLEKTAVKGFAEPVEFFEILWAQQRFGVNAGTNTATTTRLQEASGGRPAVAPRVSSVNPTPRHDALERHGGRVKQWLTEKNCGFVTSTDGEDFYVSPAAVCYPDDISKLVPGQEVAFTVKPESGAATGTKARCRPACAVLVAGEYADGVVAALPTGRPYGWIRVDSRLGDRHLVFTNLSNVGVDLAVGSEVSFRVGVNGKGAFAIDVALVLDDAVA